MDPRIRMLAHNLLDYSLDLKARNRLFSEGETGYRSMCHAERYGADCHSQNGVTIGTG